MSLADEIRDEAPVLAEVTRLPVTNPIMAQLERCRPWLEPALEGSFWTWPEVEAGVIGNKAILVPGNKAAMLTEDQIYATGRVMHVWIAGGDMDELVAMAPGVEALARLRGCKTVTIDGRRGWERILKAFGYKLTSCTLQKEL